MRTSWTKASRGEPHCPKVPSGTIDPVETTDAVSDAHLAHISRMLLKHLQGMAKIEIHRGPAHEADSPQDPTEGAIAVIEDADELRSIVHALTNVDLSPRTVVPALAGVRLVTFDDTGRYLTTIELLTARWVRYSDCWPYDGFAGQPVLAATLNAISESTGRPVWDPAITTALDTVEPSMPAASRPDAPEVEHAQPGQGSSTLCGIPAEQIVLYRHTFSSDRASCTECRHLIWHDPRAFPRRRQPMPSPMVAALSARWQELWPTVPPIGHLLRDHDHWVRFHTLPLSQRYPTNEAEYAEILHRHQTLLDNLRHDQPSNTPEVYVLTCSWSAVPTPIPRPAPLARTTPGATHWCSTHQEETDDTDSDLPPIWTHVFVDLLAWDDPRLHRLLRLVADDRTSDVILCDPDLNWLYHPYDGGADVITHAPAERDRLRDTHRCWLPTNPAGL